MHDALLVRVGERLRKAAQHAERAARVVGEVPRRKIAVRQIGKCVIKLAGRRAADLVDVDDVRMVEPRDRARLVLEALDQLFARRALGREHLDGDLAAERRLRREVDGRHAALADLAHDAVAGNVERGARLRGHLGRIGSGWRRILSEAWLNAVRKVRTFVATL